MAKTREDRVQLILSAKERKHRDRKALVWDKINMLQKEDGHREGFFPVSGAVRADDIFDTGAANHKAIPVHHYLIYLQNNKNQQSPHPEVFEILFGSVRK